MPAGSMDTSLDSMRPQPVSSTMRVLPIAWLWLAAGAAADLEGPCEDIRILESPDSMTDAELAPCAAEWDAFLSELKPELFLMAERDGIDPAREWEAYSSMPLAQKASVAHWLLSIREEPFLAGMHNRGLFMYALSAHGSFLARREIRNLKAEIEDLKAKLEGKDVLDIAPSDDLAEANLKIQRFYLWTECAPISFALSLEMDGELLSGIYASDEHRVLGASPDEGMEWLAKPNGHMSKPENQGLGDAVRASVESRLRGARILAPRLGDDNIALSVDISLQDGWYFGEVALRKEFFDPLTGLIGSMDSMYPMTRDYHFYGHSSLRRDAEDRILSTLGRNLDAFLANYLRVNADACGTPEAVR